MKKRKLRKAIIKNLLALLIIAIHISPFYVLVIMSLKTRRDFSSRWIPPLAPTLDNFTLALKGGDLMHSILNTAIIVLISTALIIVIGAMSGYPLARYGTKFSKTLSLLLLGVMMVPPLSVLVPLYRELVMINGLNTFWGIIILSITYGLPTSVFMYTNFIHTIPVALDEAALLDGCSKYAIFFRIIMPSLKPVTASVAILTGINIWNDYSFQLYVLQKPKLRTITLMLRSFFAEGNTNLNAAAAASCIAILPLIIIYLFLSKYFVQGVVDSAVK